MPFVEACRRLISIDSSPGHGTAQVMELVANLCREKGFDVHLEFENHEGAPQANLVARPRGSARQGAEFMFLSHLDTPDPGPYPLWTETDHNPFDAHIVDGKIFGLGAASGKLDFLCKLEAFSQLPVDYSWKIPPVLVATFGFHQGMAGALKIIRKNLVSPKMAVIGDSTDLRLVTAARGVAEVEITIPFLEEELKYREEHDLRESTTTQSRIFQSRGSDEDAITKMLKSLDSLPDGVIIMEVDGGQSASSRSQHAFLELEISPMKNSIASRMKRIIKEIYALKMEFMNYSDASFSPPHPELQIGMIRTKHDEVEIKGVCRIPPNITQIIYEEWMNKLRQSCLQQGASFKIVDYKRPYRAADGGVLTKGCLDEIRSLSKHEKAFSQNSTNEASLFSRIGVDCICFGPGRYDEGSPVANEFIFLNDLKVATDFYAQILRRFCL